MPKLSRVPVSGGELTVATWGEGGLPVLAIHGITASHLAWSEVARLHQGRIIAPDLRGRGGSAGLPGPFGMAAHAEDCVAVLDAMGIEQATVVGHSMGGFVAAMLVHRHPSRVRDLVLVDGGAPLPDSDVDIETLLGPAMQRLSMRFASVAEYRDLWRAHPAFGEWSPAIESYVDYDLTGTPPNLRSRVDADAVRADFRDLHTKSGAFDSVPPGTVFLRAERGLLDEPTPLYPHPEEFADRVRVRTIPGTNHYTILFGADGARAVAAELVP